MEWRSIHRRTIEAIVLIALVGARVVGQQTRPAESAPAAAERAVSDLVAILEGSGEAEIKSAARRLIAMGPVAADAMEPVFRKLDAGSDDDDLIELCLRALGAIGAPPGRIAESFSKTVARRGADPRWSPYVKLSLHRYDPTGKWSVPVLAAALRSAHPRSRRHLALELGKYGPAAAPALPALLEGFAADYPLKGKSTDPAAETIAGAWAGMASGTPMKLCPGGWSPAEAAFLAYRNPYLWAIAMMGREAQSASPLLIDVATSGHVALRPDAIRALERVVSPDVVRFLTARLGDPNPFIRLGVEDAIRFLGPRAADAREGLVKRLAEARPYELRAMLRALDAVGFEGAPSVENLVAAVRSKSPDAASIAAAHLLGVDQRSDSGVLSALQEGLRSSSPALVCASALSLGRLVPPPPAAAANLLDALRGIEFGEGMELWEATKAAYFIEALGRLGPTADIAFARLKKIARELQDRRWEVLRLAGLGEHDLARACWTIRPPPDALTHHMTLVPKTWSEPAWWRDGNSDKRAGVVRWLYRLSQTYVVLEYGEMPDAWVDWSTVQDLSGGAFLLSLQRKNDGGDDGVDIRLLDLDFAKKWAQPREPSERFRDLYGLYSWRGLIDLDEAERFGVEFAIALSAAPAPEQPKYVWSGGFSIPNPFRRTGN